MRTGLLQTLSLSRLLARYNATYAPCPGDAYEEHMLLPDEARGAADQRAPDLPARARLCARARSGRGGRRFGLGRTRSLSARSSGLWSGGCAPPNITCNVA